ncbi:integrase core domain-containing protein [Corallococcus sp. M34]|nr:integrase core domain-containing protein [Citreicoccus inhibens]
MGRERSNWRERHEFATAARPLGHSCAAGQFVTGGRHGPRSSVGRQRQCTSWFDDYNHVHPHKGLRMRSPIEYRRAAHPSDRVRFDGGNSKGLPPKSPRPADAKKPHAGVSRSARPALTLLV